MPSFPAPKYLILLGNYYFGGSGGRVLVKALQDWDKSGHCGSATDASRGLVVSQAASRTVLGPSQGTHHRSRFKTSRLFGVQMITSSYGFFSVDCSSGCFPGSNPPTSW